MEWTSKATTERPYLIAELAADIQDDTVTHMIARARDAGLINFADTLQREHAAFKVAHGFSAGQRNPKA
jgi:hypothetical protein